MESYRVGQDEIYDKIKEALDSLEGDVYQKDVLDVFHDIGYSYKNFSDAKAKRKKAK